MNRVAKSLTKVWIKSFDQVGRRHTKTLGKQRLRRHQGLRLPKSLADRLGSAGLEASKASQRVPGSMLAPGLELLERASKASQRVAVQERGERV